LMRASSSAQGPATFSGSNRATWAFIERDNPSDHGYAESLPRLGR
jgi:hypothetical protein